MHAMALRDHGYSIYRARLKALFAIPESASDLDIHTWICLGFSAARLVRLTDDGIITPLERNEIISPRALKKRMEHNRLLTIEQSDRLFRLAHIRSMAEAVFGDANKATRWLSNPKKRFSGMAPLRLLTTQQGTRQVEDMLLKIADGFAL